MEEAKIQFSRTEMELMNNADVILTKNRVLQKIKHLLEGLQTEMLYAVNRTPGLYVSPLLESTPKISRGENYLGLPYLVLDYPRQFDVVNIFAIRSMFWWGNFFSSTLQLSGDYKEEYLPNIEGAYESLARNKYFIAIHEDPWQHHFEEDYYKRIDHLDREEFTAYCRQYDHIKIATKWSLWDAHFVAEDLLESWNYLLKICLD
ncbi:MAG TPA: hypothetical protein VGE66_15000 [Chitinophagaceae bacterium]